MVLGARTTFEACPSSDARAPRQCSWFQELQRPAARSGTRGRAVVQERGFRSEPSLIGSPSLDAVK